MLGATCMHEKRVSNLSNHNLYHTPSSSARKGQFLPSPQALCKSSLIPLRGTKLSGEMLGCDCSNSQVKSSTCQYKRQSSSQYVLSCTRTTQRNSRAGAGPDIEASRALLVTTPQLLKASYGSTYNTTVLHRSRMKA